MEFSDTTNIFTICDIGTKFTEDNIQDCKFVSGSRITLNANKVCSELFEVKRMYETGVQDENVWNYAKEHPNSEIHKGVDWNEKSAAKKYQKQQIHQIIYNLRVVALTSETETGEKQVFKVNFQPFTHISIEKGYTDTFTIISNEDKYEQLKKDAYRDLLHWQQKYLGIVELKEVFDAIDKLQI